MDAFGHVNNVVYLRYLEEARIDFMFRTAAEASVQASSHEESQEEGAAAPLFQSGCVVARHEIDYVRPLFHRYEPVTVETRVTKLNAASSRLTYEIRDDKGEGDEDGTVYVRAETVIVPYDLDKGRPRRFTGAERAFLEDYFDDSAPATRLR
jgi:acyl-CoA thioester hydrolase